MCSRRSGRATHIGPVGTGQMTKLANQIIVGATMVAVAEALHFAAQGGADPAAVRKALMGGFADSKILNIHGERMVARNFVPGGPAEYELKDLRTAQALAGASGLHFTLLDCLTGMFGDMIDHFGLGLDVAGILQEVERRSGAPKIGKGIVMTGHVTLTVANGIGQIVLDRPDKMNAITPEMTLRIAARLPRDRRRRRASASRRSPAPASAPSPPAAISTRWPTSPTSWRSATASNTQRSSAISASRSSRR